VALFRSLVLLVACAATSAWGASFRISAKPGQFDARTLAAGAPTVSFGASAKLLAFASSPQWPDASYIGFMKDPIAKTAFKFSRSGTGRRTTTWSSAIA
jgi:hypothetical protein